jgi:hypothetical protein
MAVVDSNKWEGLKRYNLAELYQPTSKPALQGVVAIKNDTKVKGTDGPK